MLNVYSTKKTILKWPKKNKTSGIEVHFIVYIFTQLIDFSFNQIVSTIMITFNWTGNMDRHFTTLRLTLMDGRMP